MLQFKAGVRIKLSSPAIQRLLFTLEQLSGLDGRVFVITSGNDSTAHKKSSRHYKDEAIDIRTQDMNPVYRRTFCKRYQDMLGPQFRVLFENPNTPNEHAHAQVKMGVTYTGTFS